ncbi:MAG: single-stranded DNA-binding protein [Bacteroidota bacterium]
MEIVGRLTADATVSTTKTEKKVVHFTIAVNDSYKPKGASEWVKATTYVNCSYWLGGGIAKILTKGTLIEVYGRISLNAWTNKDGEAKGSLNFHVNSLKLHSKGNAAIKDSSQIPSSSTELNEDLPF